MFTEELAASPPRFHQFDETQLDGDVRCCGSSSERCRAGDDSASRISTVLTLTFSKLASNGRSIPAMTVEFILPGNGMKLASVKAITADVDASKSSISASSATSAQTVTIGGDRYLANSVVSHSGDDIGKVAA